MYRETDLRRMFNMQERFSFLKSAESMENVSPPWFTLWEELKHTIGLDADVDVQEMETTKNPFVIPVVVKDSEKAAALASVLNLDYNFGSVRVITQVQDGDGTKVTPATPASEQAFADMIKMVLKGNPLFVDAVVRPFAPGTMDVVFPIFKAAVVQFFNDELSDKYHNYNELAARVFKKLLHDGPGGIPPYCSTEKIC